MAVVAQDFDWDWPAAEREYRRAIELDPNYATAHHWFAELLALTGRFDDAHREMERARQLDPLSLIVAADNGVILYYERQYERSIEQLRAVLDMEPLFPRGAAIVYAYAANGMYADAEKLLDAWQTNGVDGPWLWAQKAYVEGRAGRPEGARAALVALEELSRRQPVDPLTLAYGYIATNDRDRVFAALEHAYREHSITLINLKVDPVYDSLRADPRFRDLLRRMGLAL